MSADNWAQCPRCGKDLREDFDIGIYNGKFEVDYKGECQGDTEKRNFPFKGCGFIHRFKHEERVTGDCK